MTSIAIGEAEASTVIELTVGELATRATAVVAGTPVEKRSVWESTDSARGQRIVTYTRVRVDRVVDGQAGGEVWVRTLGGQVEGIGQHVDGEAVLGIARPALLFLAARADGTHGVVGMAQGSYPLDSGSGGGAAAIRLTAPTGLGRVLPKLVAPAAGAAAIASARRPAARVVLPGQSLDDVAKLIASEKQAIHAP